MMDRYENRLSLLGSSRREREVFRLKNRLKKRLQNNPSYKNVKIDGEDRKLIINTSTQPYYKEYESLPDEKIYAGQIVEWRDSHWLVINADSDDEIYVDGKLTQCNWILKWQDKSGKVIERWCVKSNSSSYSQGNEGEAMLKFSYDQALILIPYDEETILLERDMRFFLDNNKKIPSVYRLSRIDTVSDVRDDHGYISLFFSEDQYNDDRDNIDLMLCDYFEYNHFDIYISKIVYISKYITNGFKEGVIFKAKFIENDEEIKDVEPMWELKCDFKDDLIIKENGDSISIASMNENNIGRSFTLVLNDKDNNYTSSELLLEVVGY